MTSGTALCLFLLLQYFAATASAAFRASPDGTQPGPDLAAPTPEPKIDKLPWPHQPPGLTAAQVEQFNRSVWVINNFPLFQADERGDWCYLHGGLDIVTTNGAPIYAIKGGWVKSVTHSAVTVADAKDESPSYGWSFAHLGRIKVHEGDFVAQGTQLGVVEFTGLPHTHLDKVFSRGGYWSSWRYICFPDDHFTFEDQEPPTIETPFYFFEHDSDRMVQPQPNGTIAVRGDIDIVVAMRDGGRFAHSQESGFGDRLAVARIEYRIAPAENTNQARSFLSFDFRKSRFLAGTDFSGRPLGTAIAKMVYKHWSFFGNAPGGDRNLSYYIISHGPANAPATELEPALASNCWHTAALTKGAPAYPDGDYIITVTAFDSHENSASKSMRVSVDNARRFSIAAKEPGRGQPAAEAEARSRHAELQAAWQETSQLSLDECFQRLGHDKELGLPPFTILNALIARANETEANRDETVSRATSIVDDQNEELRRRWQSCYVLSGTRDPRGIPPISRALNQQNKTLRAVAACALGQFDQAEASAALRQAAESEKSPAVQEEINKALNRTARQ